MTGFKASPGSWKIMEILAPRIVCQEDSSTRSRSWFWNWIEPATLVFAGNNPRMERASVLLPDPDSPSIPIISPGASSKLTACKAVTDCPPPSYFTVSPWTVNNGEMPDGIAWDGVHIKENSMGESVHSIVKEMMGIA